MIIGKIGILPSIDLNNKKNLSCNRPINQKLQNSFTPLQNPPPNKELEQVSFYGLTTFNSRIDNVFRQFNKPVVPMERIQKWLSQFEEQDRETALLLLESIDMKSYTDVFAESKQLHQKLTQRLKQDGFDNDWFEDVDFSRAYSAKSGDFVSYMYRKANKIRGVSFKPMEKLVAQPQNQAARALVLLDDYAATGVQLIYEYVARIPENANLLSRYKKVYVLLNTANEKAIEKFKLLEQGRIKELTDIIIGDYSTDPSYAGKQGYIFDALSRLRGLNIEFIYHNHEIPLLSQKNTKLSEQEKEKLRGFLEKYNVYKYPLGVGNNQGHTAFFYNAPNTLPDILWNPKIGRKECPQTGQKWEPLMPRTDDMSVYAISDENFMGTNVLPKEKQVF